MICSTRVVTLLWETCCLLAEEVLKLCCCWLLKLELEPVLEEEEEVEVTRLDTVDWIWGVRAASTCWTSSWRLIFLEASALADAAAWAAAWA